MKDLIFLVFITLSLNTTGQEHPNFVVFIGDDISQTDIGAYGNKGVHTPEIDRLSEVGVRFDNAYLTISSCSPSRCSIITGRYPHNTGAAELHTPLPESQKTFVQQLSESGYHTVMAGKTHVGPHAESHFSRVLPGGGPGAEGHWIKSLKERPGNKPFFMWYAAIDAHHPWEGDDHIFSHTAEDVKVPVYHPDTPKTRADYVGYYNEISRYDYFIGEVVDELQNQGVLENTFIIVMADNGRPFPRDKGRVYDSSVKTPFIVYAPFMDLSPGTRDQLVSSIDIAPAILDLAGIEVPETVQGVSFLPVLKNEQKIRDYVFAERNWHVFEAHERMVRYENWVYIRNARPQLSAAHAGEIPLMGVFKSMIRLREEGKLEYPQNDIFIRPRPAEELYNISNDPDQIHNLVERDEHSHILNELRSVLDKWQETTGDSVPENLTPDRDHKETRERLSGEFVRGAMPGADRNAARINSTGPVKK